MPPTAKAAGLLASFLESLSSLSEAEIAWIVLSICAAHAPAHAIGSPVGSSFGAPAHAPAHAPSANRRKSAHAPVMRTGVSESFEKFWSLYPKKKDRKDAERIWNKLQPDQELQNKLQCALQAQMLWDEWRKDGGQFIPYAKTWLNGRRWEDEPAHEPAHAPSRKAVNDAWKNKTEAKEVKL